MSEITSAIIINGVDIDFISTYEVETSKVVGNSKTNALGQVRVDVIRGGEKALRNIKCEFGYLTQDQVQTVVQALDPNEFSVTYFDPRNGQRTANFRCTSFSSPVFSLVDELPRWEKLSFTLSEVGDN